MLELNAEDGGEALVIDPTREEAEQPEVSGESEQPEQGQPAPEESASEYSEAELPEAEPAEQPARAKRSKKPAKAEQAEADESAPEDDDADESVEPDQSGEQEEPSEEEASSFPEIELTDDELAAGASALIFAAPDPLTLPRLCALLGGVPKARVLAALGCIEERLDGLGMELLAIAGGYQIMTRPAQAEFVQRLFAERRVEKVSPAALETLAVVAYRQPVTKAEIEAIRGVQAGPILRNLVDRGLIRVLGRAEVPGHPLQYGTTRSFLDRFGLQSLDDLPRDGELSVN